MRRPITWVTSDWHLNHIAIQKYCDRPKNCDELILKRHSHFISKQDILIHLGDVIFYKYPSLTDILNTISGKKILCMGNHDKKSKIWYLNHGFDFVVDYFVNNNILFSHIPIKELPSWIRYNVHGHCHLSKKLPDWHTKRHIFFSLEENNYYPRKLEDLINEF